MKLTNLEKIRAMSAEELGLFLALWIDVHYSREMDPPPEDRYYHHRVKEWLEAEAK